MTATGVDLGLVARVESAAVEAWPPTVRETTPEGWVLRATPGLDRGRCNHALTPCRPLSGDEVAAGVAAAERFADAHGIPLGIQFSPFELHAALHAEFVNRGWESRFPALVLGAPVTSVISSADGSRLALEVSDRADEEWLAAWAECESARDVEAHARTVLARLAGRARFVRDGRRAVGIAVQTGDLVGLFSLAVAPGWRRRGLGSALVRGLLAGCRDETELAYLQVEESNTAALALYDRLGFERLYTYRHCVRPARGATTADQQRAQGAGC